MKKLHGFKKYGVVASLTAVLFTGVFITGCTDELSQPVEEKQKSKDEIEVKLIDGHLSFESQEKFLKATEILKDKQKNLDQWEKQFSGFVSMRTAFEAITEKQKLNASKTNSLEGLEDIVSFTGEGEKREAVRNISDPILATLTSKDGILLIGKDAYKFDYDKFLIIKDYNATKVNQLKGARTAGNGITEGKITHTKSPANVNAKVAESDVCLSEYWTGSWFSSTKRRLVSDIDYTVYVPSPNIPTLYINVTVMSKHQSRYLGTWWTTSISKIRLNGSLFDQIAMQTIYFDETNFNTGWVQFSYPAGNCSPPVGGYAGPCEYAYRNINVYSSGICEDGVPRNCSVSK
jgi:hypothetical protein